jgi:hypothetical protein
MAARFWVGGTGTWNAASTTNWSATSGGASGASAPVAADTVTFDANSGTGTCTTAAGAVCTSATLNSSTLALTLGANLTQASFFTLTLGSLNLNNNVLSCSQFSSSNANIRSIAFGTGNITLTGNNLTIWNTTTATNLTYTGTPLANATYSGATGTRTVSTSSGSKISLNVSAGADIVTTGGTSSFIDLNLTGFSGTFNNVARNISGNYIFSATATIQAGAGAQTFNGTSGTQQITTNAKTLDFPLTFNGVGGTFAFQDALTQGSTRAFTITNGTVQLKAGVTSTVGSFVANNASTKYLQSTTPGTQATISQASGTVTVSDLTIQDSNATGGASWTAYADYENIDAGNNDGWDFSLSPPYATYEPPIIIRSFTQPRRF